MLPWYWETGNQWFESKLDDNCGRLRNVCWSSAATFVLISTVIASFKWLKIVKMNELVYVRYAFDRLLVLKNYRTKKFPFFRLKKAFDFCGFSIRHEASMEILKLLVIAHAVIKIISCGNTPWHGEEKHTPIQKFAIERRKKSKRSETNECTWNICVVFFSSSG